MRTKQMIPILVMLFLTSCLYNSSDSSTKVEDIIEAESKVIESGSDIVSGSFSRNKGDMIRRLYEEALEKDADLKQLDDEMREMDGIAADSLVDYRKYVRTNSSYWSAVNRRINLLQDSLLQKKTKVIFDGLQKKYLDNLVHHQNKETVYLEQKRILNDQLVLMELFVTAKMMRAYQNNQRPRIETFEAVIKKYKKLLVESQKYTKLN